MRLPLAMQGIALLLGIAAADVGAGAAAAADGAALLHGTCAACHRLEGPAPQTLAALWARKAPDLFYAGNKYREEWVAAWLQKPTRIRPAGEFYIDHIARGEKSDVIDEAGLAPHPALDAPEAKAVAAELMRLRAHDALVQAEHLEPGTISKSMGEMVFDKFLGCMACHEIEPGFGGASGPELYDAARRLQPGYMASFIRSPQAWDPKGWMPNKHVSDANIAKLVRYLQVLSAEDSHAK